LESIEALLLDVMFFGMRPPKGRWI
jgi:hypothetical protein